MLVLSGIKLLGVPHASLIIVISLGAAAVVVAVFFVRQWLAREPAAANR